MECRGANIPVSSNYSPIYTGAARASVGLGGPGDRGRIGANNSSTGGKVDLVKEIMEHHLAQMKKFLSEASAAEWAKELADARQAVKNVDPNLAGLEDQLIAKRLKKYDVQGVY